MDLREIFYMFVGVVFLFSRGESSIFCNFDILGYILYSIIAYFGMLTLLRFYVFFVLYVIMFYVMCVCRILIKGYSVTYLLTYCDFNF